MNTAELLIACLENEGVEYIFGLPGEENLHVIEALANSSIRFITVRHEQGAAFMADVYGRLTGKAGVCLSTLGPGATNLMTGVADANLDGAPLIAITGQVGTDRMHIESHQYLDLVAMFKPVTQWSTQIVRPNNTPETVRKAFKIAQSEKPGAVHIDLPENIAAMEASGKPLSPARREQTVAAAKDIEAAAALMAQAKHPLILVGNGAIRAQASEALTALVDKLQIPVANTFMGKGAVSFENPRSLWSVGLQQRDFINCGLDRADLILTVGYDLIEYSPKRWNPEGTLAIIHIGGEPAEIDSSYIPQVELVGDISATLQALTEQCETSSSLDAYTTNLRESIVEEYEQYAQDSGFPIKPQKIIYDLRQVLGPQAIVLSDVGAHKMWMARHYHCHEPNTCLISNGFAAMGIALPGAIAAKLVHPDRRVVAVMGDGGFMMNSQELETAVRLGVAFVTLIFHDGGYGLIEWKQNNQFGHASQIKFGNPDFIKYAESFGVKGFRIDSAAALIPTLEEALAWNGPTLIDCPVDYGENLKFSEKAGKLVCQI